MKLLIAISAILVLFFTNSAEADCSPKSWNVVKDLIPSAILGRWYCVLRFANGKNDTSDCLWHDVKMHPTIPNAIYETDMRTFENGRRRHQTEGVVTLADPSSTNGVLHIKIEKGADLLKYATSVSYNEYGILRACFGGEEMLWVYARNQVPSNSTMAKIYKDLDDQGIDRSKLISMCTNVPASALA